EEQKCLLADLEYGFARPDPKKSAAEDRQHLPLADVWENWWLTRGLELRDPDGMELLRAMAWYDFVIEPYRGPGEMVKVFPDAAKTLFGDIPAEAGGDRWKLRNLLSWLVRLHPP